MRKSRSSRQPSPPHGRGAMRNPEGVSHYRQWYWALMDYGSYLKQTIGNLNTVSKHYAKQSRFSGSQRQIRGQVLRLLSENRQTVAQLKEHIADDRLAPVLADLTAEGMVAKTAGHYHLT